MQNVKRYLEGQELESVSGEVKKLMILLHGIGSDGNDLIELVPYFQREIQDMHAISPNAIEDYDSAPFGFQWFSLRSREESIMLKEIERANNTLKDYINKQLDRFKLTPQDLILAGFSQGGMLALHHALMRKEQLFAAICFSGALIIDETKIQNKDTPIIMVHGKYDNVVDVNYMQLSVQKLQSLGVKVKSHIVENLRHSIDLEAVNFVLKALKR